MSKKSKTRKLISRGKPFAFSYEDCEIYTCIVGPNNATSSKINLPKDWKGNRVILVRSIQKEGGDDASKGELK